MIVARYSLAVIGVVGMTTKDTDIHNHIATMTDVRRKDQGTEIEFILLLLVLLLLILLAPNMMIRSRFSEL